MITARIVSRVLSASTLALVVTATMAPGAFAAAAPSSFDVDIEDAPPVKISPDPDKCVLSGSPPTQSVCTVDYANDEKLSSSIAGTVTDTESGLTGEIVMTCDFNLRMHVVSTYVIAASSLTFGELSGGGDQDCTWVMSFKDTAKSQLMGRLTGDTVLALVPGSAPPAMQYSGTFALTVTSGSGAYNGRVGSGTFTQLEQELLPTDTSGAPRVSIQGRADSEASSLKLRLRRGAAQATVASPVKGGTVKKSSALKLRVVGAPRMKCTATARKGKAKAISLGKAADAPKIDGAVTFSKRLSTLANGAWNATATCTIPAARKGQKPKTIVARSTFRRA